MTMNHDVPPRGKGCIPYLIVALVLGALIYLVMSSGSASSDSGPRSASIAAALPSPESNPAPFNPDDLFLNLVHSAPGDLVSLTGSDTDLTSLGRALCSTLSAGHTVGEVYTVAEGAGYPAALLPTVLDAAAAAYCPQYNSDVAAYESEWTT